MDVLVTYATRHGATRGIAERIATRLSAADEVTAVLAPVDEVDDVEPYDAIVIGGAAYMFHWQRAATRFVRRHQEVLARRPVWLFSSGPLGTDLVDEDGNDVLEAARPKEFDELDRLVEPEDEAVFFGAHDPDAPPMGFGEHVMWLLPAAREALPAGDFRDWPRIDAWADGIAARLDELRRARAITIVLPARAPSDNELSRP